MYCPLGFTYNRISAGVGDFKVPDCLKEECAWWGEYTTVPGKKIGCCSIPAIALALSDIFTLMSKGGKYGA